MANDDAEEKEKTSGREMKSDAGDKEKPEELPSPAAGGDEIEFVSLKKEGDAAEGKVGLKTSEPHVEETKGLKSRLKKRDAEVKALQKEIEKLKDKYLRTLAEMENLRKRLEREKAEFRHYALSEFLRELLVVLDNFERALQFGDQTDGKSLREGVEMIYRLYLDLLMKKGVVPIEVKDRRFDPAIHQAVMTEESEEVEEPEIAEELQRGYLHHERLLRPAMVKVLVPKKKEES
ncbi:MAG: nucleotide exchange factor GrpE [Candidatus Aminicenantes bacterium]|nr:nucleotide exchange factor GrpE [Candidatus Aminicenantes bacterium]